MSEDFDGETHDVDNDSGDESGESEDEDLDEQMGDIDGADETLDEKLWADSDNEDNEENVSFIHFFDMNSIYGLVFKFCFKSSSCFF